MTRVAELMVITGPIDQVGWAIAAATVTSASSARVLPRNGPPDAVTTSLATSPASPPTMLLPIALALHWPNRLTDVAPPCDFSTPSAWTFEPLDETNFPAIRLGRQAGTAGGCLPAVYNAANEEAVAAFVLGHVPFTAIPESISEVMDAHAVTPLKRLEDVLEADAWARERSRAVLGRRLAARAVS